MKNTPQNAKYTSPKIQKEILHIFANKVRNVIREEIGDAKFCILVDECGAPDPHVRKLENWDTRMMITWITHPNDKYSSVCNMKNCITKIAAVN